MNTVTVKKQTAFRLSESLIDKLKAEATKENRSLNNYVECILMDSVYSNPNDETIAAIEEARAGQYAGRIDTSSVEAMIKSCE